MTTKPTPSPDAVELKPCPFCGKTEYLSTRRSSEYNDRQWTVRCCHVSEGHGCGADCGFGSTTPAEAISKWNTRAAPTMSDKELEMEAENLSVISRTHGVTLLMIKEMFVELAKKYRG